MARQLLRRISNEKAYMAGGGRPVGGDASRHPPPLDPPLDLVIDGVTRSVSDRSRSRDVLIKNLSILARSHSKMLQYTMTTGSKR